MSQEFKDITDLSYFSIMSLKEFTDQNPNYSNANYFTIIFIKNLNGFICIDDKKIENLSHNLFFLTPNQSFQITNYLNNGIDGFVILFNREFYCVDFHDSEISCKGLLFINNIGVVNITLDPEKLEDFNSIYNSFSKEIEEQEGLVGEMLRNLLKNLLIKANRLLKSQLFGHNYLEEDSNIVRKFNSLVELHFKEIKNIGQYAQIMRLNTKQLTNKINKINNEGPSKIIKRRIITEAKRLLIYTDLNIKEIAFQLGYNDQYHFSKNFSKEVGVSPTLFKNNHSYR